MLLEKFSAHDWKLTHPGGGYNPPSSTAGFLSRIPTIVPPPQNAVVTASGSSTGLQAVGDGVLSLGAGGAKCSPHILLVPIGTGSANYFYFRVLGWRPTKLGGVPLWIPVEIVTIFCNTSQTGGGNLQSWGVSGSDLPTTAIFCDDLGVTNGAVTGGPLAPAALGTEVFVEDMFQIGAGVQQVGFAKIPTFGFPYLEVIYSFDLPALHSSGPPTNTLWCEG